MRNENNRLFEGFERPLPPPDLRERTLRAAGSALLRPAPSDSWRTLWESAWFRLVWTGGVAVLLVSHVVISNPGNPVSYESNGTGIPVAANDEDELSEIVDLPRIIALRPSLVGFRPVNARLGGRTSEGDVS